MDEAKRHERTRQASARRILADRGITLVKSRRRVPTAYDKGGYRLLEDGRCVAGLHSELTLDFIEEFIARNQT